MGPDANQRREPKDGSTRRLPVRLARMEPRYRLAACQLAWAVAAGPPFPEYIDRDLTCGGSVAYVALADRGGASCWCPRPTPGDSSHLVGYMQLLVARRFVVLQYLAVKPYWQRRGIGSELFALATGYLMLGRPRLLVDVPQGSRYLAAHLFLVSSGCSGGIHPRERDELYRFELVRPSLFD